MSPEQKKTPNRYVSWTPTKLIRHKELIEEALRLQEEAAKEAYNEKLRNIEGVRLSVFVTIHLPELGCQLRKVELGVEGLLPSSDSLGPYELIASGYYCEKHRVGTEGVKEALLAAGR